MKSNHHCRNKVHLSAFDPDGKQVFVKHLQVHSFYQNSHPVLDEAQYRKSCRIVRLCGVIYDGQGAVSQEFVVCFDAAGLCICDAARYADGSVVGPWEQLRRTTAATSASPKRIDKAFDARKVSA
jgi:hypothetical protein